MANANLLLVLHDVSNKWTRGTLSPKILRLLHLYPDKESVLVLNKIDLLKDKRLLLDLTSKLSEGIIGGNLIASSRPSPQKQRMSRQESDNSSVNSSNVQLSEPTHFQKMSEKEVSKRIEGKIGWPHFSSVFMISAIDGDGVSDVVVRNYRFIITAIVFLQLTFFSDRNIFTKLLSLAGGSIILQWLQIKILMTWQLP